MNKKIYSIQRRTLLKSFGAGAALSLSCPRVLLAQSSEPDLPDYLSFVDKRGIGPDLNAPFVEENFIPLHKEIKLPSMPEASPEYQAALGVLKSEFELSGQNWEEEYRLTWTYQHYGVPDESEHCARLLDYCKNVQSYLYENLQGLNAIDFNWQPLTENAIQGEHLALAGKHTYFVLRVSAVDAAGTALEPYLVRAQAANRAIHYINGNTHNKTLLYVIRGETALVSPFSEMLHLSTHDSAMRYAQKLTNNLGEYKAKNVARNMGETVTESAAVLMALHFMQDQGVDERNQQIMYHAQSLRSQLPEFQHSLAFMQKYGIQSALEMYNDSPAAYMKRLKGMG